MTQLPDNEKTFEIEIEEGEVTRQRYQGKFTCKCILNVGERAAADVLQKRLNDNLTTLEEETYMYHMILAQLEVRLTAGPDWFAAAQNGRALKDMNVLYELYTKCMEAERDWRLEVWGEPEEEEKKLKSTTEKEEKSE
jgi:hypothetical protein